MLLRAWGGDRYAWTSPVVLGLGAATVVLTTALVARERRAEDPIVRVRMLRSRVVGVASVGLFLTTAALFAVVVFVPLFLQATTGADPSQAGLVMAPMMLGIALSTAVAGRRISRTGRYRHSPPVGLATMAAALVVLAAFAGERSQAATGLDRGDPPVRR